MVSDAKDHVSGGGRLPRMIEAPYPGAPPYRAWSNPSFGALSPYGNWESSGMLTDESLNHYDDLQLAAVLGFDGWVRELVRRFCSERRPIVVRIEAVVFGRLCRDNGEAAVDPREVCPRG